MFHIVIQLIPAIEAIVDAPQKGTCVLLSTQRRLHSIHHARTSPLEAAMPFAIYRRSLLIKPIDSDVLGQKVGALSLARIESTGEGELSVDAIDTVHGVEVLNAGDLEASCGALARSDRGVGKEVLPDAEPAGAVLGVDLVLVAEPVAVPQIGRASCRERV